jgi:hypothetical protein
MGTGTPATALKPRARRPIDGPLLVLGAVGAGACVLATITLAAGHVAGAGPKAVGAAGFLLLVAWCFAHRRVDHTLAALGLYLGLLDGYIKLSTGSSAVTLARDVLVVAMAAGALVRTSRSGERLNLPPLGGLVIAFAVVVVVQLLNPDARNLAGGLAGVRQHLEFVPLFFLGSAYLRRESQIRTLLVLVVTCAAIGGVVSFVQSNLSPQELAAWGPGYAERVLGSGGFAGAGRTAIVNGASAVRPFGLGSDAGSGALFAAVALPSLIALLMAGPNRYRLLVAPLAVGLALALATSGSRNALVVAFVSLFAFGLIAARSRNALRAIVGLGVGTLLVYGGFHELSSDNPAATRTKSIVSTNALSTYQDERGASLGLFGGYVKDHPLGVGIGRSGPATGAFATEGGAPGYNAETEWNFMVLETGVLGLGLYLLINLRLLDWTIRRIRNMQSATQRLYLAALAAPLAGLIAQGFAGPTTVSVPAAPYFWLVAGILSYWLAAKYRREPLAAAVSM